MAADRTGPPRLGLPRPTGRGIVVALAMLLLWALGAFTGLVAALDVAAALLVVLVASALMAGGAGVGLRLRRQVLEPRVTAPGASRVDLTVDPGALLARIPLGTGVVRCTMPDALGGGGELVLRPCMPHLVAVGRRGEHALGPCTVRVHDVFGLFRVTRTQALPVTVMGLPRVERLDLAALQRARLAHDGTLGAGAAHGVGEIGALARQYVPGDDLRRIHWRASARTGGLMTREDEPLEAETAVIVLDDRRGGPPRPELEDRLVSAVATFGAMLRDTGWSVRVLDARGDEVVRAAAADRSAAIGSRGSHGSVLAQESGAAGDHEAIDALARLTFRDTSPTAVAELPAGGVTTGDIALALVLLPGAPHGTAGGGARTADPGPLDRLRALAPMAGHAGRRVAVVLGDADPAGAAGSPDDGFAPHDAPAPAARSAAVSGLSGGTWSVVRAGERTPLAAVVDALAQDERGPA